MTTTANSEQEAQNKRRGRQGRRSTPQRAKIRSSELGGVRSFRRGTGTNAARDHCRRRGVCCGHRPHPDKLQKNNTSQVVRASQSLDTNRIKGRHNKKIHFRSGTLRCGTRENQRHLSSNFGSLEQKFEEKSTIQINFGGLPEGTEGASQN